MRDQPEILLVGAGGPLGVALAEELARAGGRHLATGRRGPVPLDVSDRAAVSELLRAAAPRAIVYLANPTALDAGRAQAAVADLSALITEASRFGAERFVLTSSAAVYGDQWTRPVRESDELAGRSDYALLKVHSERAMRDAADRAGLSAVALRIFNVYGPSFQRSLINRVIDGPPPTMRVTSSFVRDYVHSRDVARAIALALARNDVVGAVNVGSGHPLDNLTLVGQLPEDRFIVGDDAGEPSFSVADTDLASATLGFRAQIDVRDVLRTGRLDR